MHVYYLGSACFQSWPILYMAPKVKDAKAGLKCLLQGGPPQVKWSTQPTSVSINYLLSSLPRYIQSFNNNIVLSTSFRLIYLFTILPFLAMLVFRSQNLLRLIDTSLEWHRRNMVTNQITFELDRVPCV